MSMSRKVERLFPLKKSTQTWSIIIIQSKTSYLVVPSYFIGSYEIFESLDPQVIFIKVGPSALSVLGH